MRYLVRRNALAYRPGVITNPLLEAWLVRRPKRRIGSGFFVRWLTVAIFCYLLSGQALGTRDQLGTSLDWHVYEQLSLFLVSVTIAWAVWATRGVSPRPSNSLWLFLTLGLAALFSSVRSFWPALSIVKGCMFCLVLLLAELLCNTFSSAAILRAIYYGIVSVFTVAILVGMAFPDTYPLRVIDESGRQHLALFTYIHGDLGYMAGLGVFIGRLPAVRTRWYFQVFLAGLTIASGSRVCACALIVVWAAIQLCGARDFPLRISAMGGAVAFLLLLGNSGSWDFGASIHDSLQAIYGRYSLAQSPLALDGRVELWKDAAGVFRNSFLLGFGFDGARDQLLRLLPWSSQAHNGFLDLLLAAGGAGLISFLAGWISAIRNCFKSKTGRSALAIHCFLLIVAITSPIFTLNQYFSVFLILCLHYWTRSLSVDETERLLIQQSGRCSLGVSTC
jgi:O-antigen ligase